MDEIPLFAIFEKLCNFSYKGDIRMRWKFENAKKVENIVQGSYSGLVDLYTPFLEEMEYEGLIFLVRDAEEKISGVKFRHKREN